MLVNSDTMTWYTGKNASGTTYYWSEAGVSQYDRPADFDELVARYEMEKLERVVAAPPPPAPPPAPLPAQPLEAHEATPLLAPAHLLAPPPAPSPVPPPPTPPSVAPSPSDFDELCLKTSLRDWLSKLLDSRILDRTHAALEREEVFSVADLAMFCALPRFNECLTALTREKVINALKDEGLISSTAPSPPSPLGPGDSTPDWLAEASGILLEKTEAQVPAAVAAPASAPAVNAVIQSPRRPSRRSQSFQRREQRASSPRRGHGESQREQPPSSGPISRTEIAPLRNLISRAEIAPLGNLVCKFFHKGTCTRGAGCRFLHPSEGANGAASGGDPGLGGGQDDGAGGDGGEGGDRGVGGHCFLCGAQGHWKRDCPLALAQKTGVAVVGGRSGRGAPLVAVSVLSNAPTTAPGIASVSAAHPTSTQQFLQPKSEVAAWKQVGTPSRSQRPRSASFGLSLARKADKTSDAAAAVDVPPPPPEMEASEDAPADGGTSRGLKRSASLRRREQRKRAAEREKAAAAVGGL